MKRFWRIVIAREYLAWRRNGRLTRRFNSNGALQAYRSRNNCAWYLPPHADKERIEYTRLWQLKNGLNYGRY